MKEVLVYAIAGIAGIFILGYSIHMMIGGLVSSQTEQLVIAGACIAGVAVLGFMAWDVSQRRRGKR